MGLVENTDYAGDMIARLIGKLSDVSHADFIRTFAAEIQEFETAAFQVLTERWLDTAVGVQLDGLGQIIGRERAGSDDDTYRLLLRAQILLNLSSGTVPQILAIIEKIIPGFLLELVQHFPKSFTLLIGEEPLLPAGTGLIVASVLTSATDAGARGLLQYHETDPVFRLDGANGSKLDGGFHLSVTIEG